MTLVCHPCVIEVVNELSRRVFLLNRSILYDVFVLNDKFFYSLFLNCLFKSKPVITNMIGHNTFSKKS